VAQTVTSWSLNTSAESVNQLVTPESKLAKVITYARDMEDGYIITVPMDIELFGTDITICLEHNDLERFIDLQEGSVTCIYLYIK